MSTTITKRKKGAPIKFNEETRKRLIGCISIGTPLIHAPAACGVSYSGFCEYRNSHPEFEREIQTAIANAIVSRLGIIQRAANMGDANCAKWFLEKCHSPYFGRNRIEVTGADGQPLIAGIQLFLPVKDGEPHQALPDAKNEPSS